MLLLLLASMSKTAVQKKKLGFALNFCPVCRCVTCCRAAQLRVVQGLTIGPMGGTPQKVSHELRCTACETPVEVEGRPVTSSKKPIENIRIALDSLLSDEARPLRARLDLEERAETSGLSATERRDLIAEPFIALDYGLNQAMTRGAYKAISQLAGFGLIVDAFIALGSWVAYAAQRGRPGASTPLAVFAAAAVTTAALIAFLVYRSFTGRRRVAAKTFVPRVAHSLAVLGPTVPELEQTIGALRDRGLKIARVVEARQVEEAIASVLNAATTATPEDRIPLAA
jgi:hypothetical protein